MNKQGQVNLSMGLLISAMVAIIVGAVLMTTVATYVGQTTSTFTNNDTADGTATTAPAAGATSDLTGMELIGTPTVINATNATDTIATDNWTIDEGVSTTTSLKTIRLTMDSASTYGGEDLNITYTYGTDGYIESSGARGIVGIILIFMAVGIAVIALVPVLRNKMIDLAGI